jgi:hypothetical protein
MAIHRFQCPNCERELRSAPGLQPGRKIKCPHCQQTFAVSSPGKRLLADGTVRYLSRDLESPLLRQALGTVYHEPFPWADISGK